MQYSDTLPPLATGKHKSSHYFQNVTIPTKQEVNIICFTTHIIFKYSLTPVLHQTANETHVLTVSGTRCPKFIWQVQPQQQCQLNLCSAYGKESK
jgi:hypothetical protein